MHTRSSLQTPRLALAAALAAAVGLAGPAAAEAPSSFAESRGYQNCVAAAEDQGAIYAVDSSYYIYDRDDSRSYYLNGYGRRDGANSPVRIACQTTPSGHRVLAVSLEQGHFAGRVVESPVVARN